MKINWKIKLGALTLLGAAAGFSYYYYIGCDSGCLITGNPYISTAYGSLIGLILGFPLKGKIKNESE